MPIPSLRSHDHKLDNRLRAALTTGPQRRTVWAMLHDTLGPDCVTRNAIPIKVKLEIIAEDGQLVWHPVAGVTLDGQEVPPELLQGDRVWWCSWTRRFAEARLRVELEQRQQQPDQSAADTALAGMEAWEKEIASATARALGGVDGDRQLRVLATFPAPRGEG